MTITSVTIVVLGSPAGAHAVGRLFAQAGATLVSVVPAAAGESPGFTAEDITIDLGAAAGRKRLEAILATADIFITDCDDPYLNDERLDYRTLHQRHPRLVYTRLMPRPEGSGPHSTTRAPAKINPAGCKDDPGAELAAALGTTAALLRRDKTGVGQFVDGGRCLEAALGGGFDFFPALGAGLPRSVSCTRGAAAKKLSNARPRDEADDLLAELGFTGEEIARFHAKGVID